MKLLFVTGSLVHGGAERHTITLANRLAERGHECHAAYVKDDPSQLERLQGAASVECLHARSYLDLAALRRLAELIGAHPPLGGRRGQSVRDALRLARAARAGRRARRWRSPSTPRCCRTPRSGCRCSITGRSSGARTAWCSCARRSAATGCGALVFGARATAVIHNGVDPEHWRSPRPGGAHAHAPRARARRRATSWSACRAVLRPEKNPLQLVEAIARLRAPRRRRRARCSSATARCAPAIEARARDLGVAGDVLITGFQQDVRPLLAAADAVALCSTSVETFSLAALEAMALGRPVVHSDGRRRRRDDAPRARTAFCFPRGDTRRAGRAAWPRSPTPALRAAHGRGRARRRWRRAFPSAPWSTATKDCLQQLVLDKEQT